MGSGAAGRADSRPAGHRGLVPLAGPSRRQPVILPLFYPSGDRAVMLPAAVLLLAGLGTLLATVGEVQP